MRVIFLPISMLLYLSACGIKSPRGIFEENKVPSPPHYTDLSHWAAHPDKKDMADRVPNGLKDEQSSALVDVFFLHPTTYTGANNKERNWNASVSDDATNQKTAEGSILYQASIFNGAGRVFAPYYRQAHLNVFYSKKDSVSNQRALELAYEDVEAAFEYYLEHWNQGRPFILAAHSQGAFHAMNLLRKKIEGTPLQQKLVVAYIIGYPVYKGFFKKLPSCESAEQTGCYCTWRTYERGYGLRRGFQDNVVCTNPLLWSSEPKRYADKRLNLGAVVRPFEKILPNITDAEVHRGILLSKKPKFPGSILFVRKNYHIGDLNLFYMNIRENARIRAANMAP
jgi:Protein of unknown function (DUF3089)